MNRFRDHLRSKRKKLGLSMREMERRSGVSNAFLSQVEKGTRNPTIKYLIKIADVYKENIHELLNILLSDHYNDYGAGI